MQIKSPLQFCFQDAFLGTEEKNIAQWEIYRKNVGNRQDTKYSI